MNRTAIVHIGIDKTGSTVIQGSLHSARQELLSASRILYPTIAANHSIFLSTLFRPEPPRALRMVEPDATDDAAVDRLRQKYRASFESDFARNEWDTSVISAESLCDFPQAAVTRFVDWLSEYVDDIRVIAYVRHPVDWTRSAVQQRLKQGQTFAEARTRFPRPRWRARFTPWISAVGMARFHLLSFDAVCVTPGILESFCEAGGLGKPSALSRATDVRKNESMSLEAALLLESLNRQKPLYIDGQISAERRRYRGRYGIDLIRRIPGNRFQLTGEDEVRARTGSREDLVWLNDTFGLDLYPDLFVDVSPSVVDRQTSMPQATVDAVAGLLAQLLDRQAPERSSSPRSRST